MNYQHMFNRLVGVALSVILLGLFALPANAATPVPADTSPAIPAANHCAWISNDAAGSTLLAANPELATACRLSHAPSKAEAHQDKNFPNIVPTDPMVSSTFLAANPEVMRARRYEALVNRN